MSGAVVIGWARHTCFARAGIVAPVVHCDGCGRSIRGAGFAYRVTLPDGSVAPGVAHAHTGDCATATVDALASPGATIDGCDLATWLAHLAANIGAPTDDAHPMTHQEHTKENTP